MTEKAKSQRQKFIDKARELGCDEDEEAFREKLKRIAKTDPARVAPPRAKPKQSEGR